MLDKFLIAFIFFGMCYCQSDIFTPNCNEYEDKGTCVAFCKCNWCNDKDNGVCAENSYMDKIPCSDWTNGNTEDCKLTLDIIVIMSIIIGSVVSLFCICGCIGLAWSMFNHRNKSGYSSLRS